MGRTAECSNTTTIRSPTPCSETSTAAALGFFPCEPGWSFTVCNIMGAQALRGHDTAHGTEHSDGTPETLTLEPTQ